jgi:hypothetical protein
MTVSGCGVASSGTVIAGHDVRGRSSPFQRLRTAHEELTTYIHAPVRGALRGSDGTRDAALTRAAAFEHGRSPVRRRAREFKTFVERSEGPYCSRARMRKVMTPRKSPDPGAPPTRLRASCPLRLNPKLRRNRRLHRKRLHGHALRAPVPLIFKRPPSPESMKKAPRSRR